MKKMVGMMRETVVRLYMATGSDPRRGGWSWVMGRNDARSLFAELGAEPELRRLEVDGVPVVVRADAAGAILMNDRYLSEIESEGSDADE